MSYFRRCSRTGCGRPAVATLTYVYSDSTAVVGPLATQHEPHCYDLCEGHAVGLSAPRGWELVRHDGEFAPPPPNPDALEALANAVRVPQQPEAGSSRGETGAGAEEADSAVGTAVATADPPGGGRRARRHLHSVPEARAE